MQKISVAIVGATGIVGSAILSILAERKFPIEKLYLLASERSVGETRSFANAAIPVTDLVKFDFSKTDLCFFCASNDIAEIYAPKAAALGNIVIDKSSFFRYSDAVPLVVPEVNFSHITQHTKIIASPNCNTIPIAVALKPIFDAVGITRINVATYQSVSGSGKDAVNELLQQTQQVLANQPVQRSVYPQQIAFNVLPHIDAFESNGYTREEMKIVWEMQKIFNDKNLKINPTTVRVPVLYGHSAALHIETRDKISIPQIESLLKHAPSIKLITGEMPYHTPLQDAAGQDDVYVGRLRKDISHENGVNLWVVTDNIRKGAALNAIQIAERIFFKVKTFA